MKKTTNHFTTKYKSNLLSSVFFSLIGNFRKFLAIALLTLSFTITQQVIAQVSVTATAGTLGPTTYSTVNAAFAAINAGTHQGAININIVSNSTETAACVLNSSGAGSANYTSILLRPVNDGLTISGPTVTGRGLIELNGADNVTIDGDNPNTSGINKNLTITNTAATSVTFTSVIRIATSTLVTTANNVTVKNCNLNGSGNSFNASGNTSFTATQAGTNVIFAGAGASTTAATTAPSALSGNVQNSASGQTWTNLIIDNNSINSAGKGICLGGTTDDVCPTLTITNNIIGNPTAGATNQIYWRGISINGGFGSATGTVISGNTIYVESFCGSTSAPYGSAAIDIGRINGTTAVAARRGTISNNKILRVKQNNTGGYPAFGIILQGGNNITVSNNFIQNILNVGSGSFSTTYGAQGIFISTGNNHSIYHNTVSLTGTDAGSGNIITCLSFAGVATTGCDVRNNIFSNTCTSSSTTSSFVGVYFTTAPTAGMALTMNNNAYYTGSTSGLHGIGQVSTTKSAANLYTVANFNPALTTPTTNWRAITSVSTSTNDNASVGSTSAAPFVSSSDIHLNNSASNISDVEQKGSTTTGVTTDIDGDVRPNLGTTIPDIGADEVAVITPPVISFTSISPSSNQCTATSRLVTVSITTPVGTVSGATLNYNNGSAGSVSMTNTAGTTWTGTIPAASPTNTIVTWSVTATNSLGGSATYTGTSYQDNPNLGITATATATPSTICAGAATSLNVAVTRNSTVILGTGSLTGTVAPYNPFNGGYGGMKGQYLIRASELTALGLTAGNITALTLYVSAIGTTYNGFVVQIGNTALTALTSSTIQGSLSTVKTAFNFAPTAGANAITFDTPFPWDGSSNIIVSTSWSNANTSNTSATIFYDATSFQSAVSYRKDNETAVNMLAFTGATGAGTFTFDNSSNRPRLGFTGNTAPTPTVYTWSDGSGTVGTTNPLSQSPTTNTTYTCTATVNGCPITSNAVAVTVTTVAAPTANVASSSQCGTGVPTVSVFGTPGSLRWYTTSSGGTAISGETGTSLSSYTVSSSTTLYVAAVSGSCESTTRTALTVTVASPDALTASTSASAICQGNPVSLSVVQTGSTQTYSLTWTASPSVGSGIPTSVAGSLLSSTTITPTNAGSYLYTITGVDGGCTATDTIRVNVNAAPSISTHPVSPSPYCLTGSPSLSVAATGSGLTYQWQSSASIGGTYANVAANIPNTGVTYSTPTTNILGINGLTNTYYYRCVVSSAGCTDAISNPATVTINNPSITGTTPAANCGSASLTLSATGSSGTTLKWYSAPTGGTLLATGTSGAASGSYTTPIIGTTTTYYVSAETNGTPADVTIGAGASITSGSGSLSGNNVSPFSHYYGGYKHQYLIRASELTAAGLTAGTFNSLGIVVTTAGTTYNGFALNLANTSATALTTTFATPTFTNVFSGNITPTLGTYTIPFSSSTFSWDGTSNIIIQTCWSNNNAGGTAAEVRFDASAYNAASYYRVDNTLPATVCAATTATTLTNRPQFIINNTPICASLRTAVVATINTPPTITAAGSATICSGGNTALSVSSSNDPNYTYTWTPSATVSPTTGASVTASPLSTTKYYVDAVDASAGIYNGCATRDSATVTVIPSSATASAATTSFCGSGSTTLTVTPSTGLGTATIQWQVSNDGTAWRDTLGNVASINTGVLTVTMYYHALIKIGGITCVTSNDVIVTVNNPIIIGTTPASKCGTGSVILSANGNTGTTLSWFSALTGGTLLSTGAAGTGTSSFTTPTISSTTTYYVSAYTSALGAATIGAGATTTATYPNPLYSNWANQKQQVLILASELQSAGLLAGNLTNLSLNLTSTNTTTRTGFTINLAHTSATALTTTFLTPSFTQVYTGNYTPAIGTNSFPFGTGSGSSSAFNWDGTSNLLMEICWDNTASTTTLASTATSDNTAYASVLSYNRTTTTGTPICGLTVAGTTYTVRPRYTFTGQTACYSTPRTPVVATISPAPAITATGVATICSGTSTTLNATSPNDPNYSYTWTPSGTVSPTVGASVSASPISTTKYFVNAVDTTAGPFSGCTAIDSVIVTVLPSSASISASVNSICVSGTTTLTLLPSSGYGAGTIQWQSSADSSSWTNVGTNSSTYTTGTITSTTFYQAIIRNSLGASCFTTPGIRITVNNPSITSARDSSRCGVGTVELNASSSAGTTLNWYSSASGGSIVGTGSPFTTPSLSVTTDYWVAAATVGSTLYNVGPATSAATSGAGDPSIFDDWGITFSATSPSTIKSVAVYPVGTGSLVIEAKSCANGCVSPTIYGTYTANFTGATGTKQIVPVNFNVPAGTDMKLVISSSTGVGLTDLYRESTGGSIGNFPYTVSGSPITLTSSEWGGTTTGTYYFFYDWEVSANYCESARTKVTATVTPSTSTPTLNLYTSSICKDSIVRLIASGSSSSGVLDTIFREGFNAGSPAGWNQTQSSVGGTPALSRWRLRPNNYYYLDNLLYDNYFHSNDNSQFFLTNSDEQAGTSTSTFLTTVNFSTVGYSSASLNFFQVFEKGSGDTALVEISTDNGATFTNVLATYLTTQGNIVFDGLYTNDYYMTKSTIDLSAFLNQPVLRVRFRYSATDDWWWAIDNVSVTGVPKTKYTWSPNTDLYVNAAATIPYNSTTYPDKDTLYTKAQDTITYVVTASVTTPPTINECTGRDSVKVNVSQIPTASLNPVKQYLCDANAELSANSITPVSSVISWSNVSGSGTLSSTSSNPTTVNGLTSGTSIYELKLTNGACVDKPIGKDTIITPTIDATNITSTTACNLCIYSDGTTKTLYNSLDGRIIAKVEDDAIVSPAQLNETQICVKFDGSVQSITDNFGNQQPYLQRQWTIHPANATKAKVTLYFTDAELLALQAAANLGVYQFSGYDLWITKYSGGQDGSFTAPASAGGVYVPATFSAFGSNHKVEFEVDSFSTFYIHPALFPFSALPVELVSFTAWNAGNVNQLQWKTASEINSLKYIIEKSVDGSRYTYIGEKPAAGNSSQLLTYDFTDNNPVVGNNYYRLKIVDIDGKFAYSNVVNVPVTEAVSNNFTRVYPNPTSGKLNVEIQSTSVFNTNVLVYDVVGNKVFEQSADLVKGLNTLQFNFTSLAKGAYVLNFTDNSGKTHVTKFVKD